LITSSYSVYTEGISSTDPSDLQRADLLDDPILENKPLPLQFSRNRDLHSPLHSAFMWVDLQCDLIIVV